MPPCDIAANSKHKWQTLSLQNPEDPLFRLRKYVDKGLKNHYIISKKTSITNGKNTYIEQLCNHQQIN